MKLWRYIQGFRKGKEAHKLEREAMEDPFLADALEGYDRVKGDHTERISQMRKRISSSAQKRTRIIGTWSIAASLLICVGLGAYFLIQEDQKPIAQHILQSEEEDLSFENAPLFEKEPTTSDEKLSQAPLPPAPVTQSEIQQQNQSIKKKKIAKEQVLQALSESDIQEDIAYEEEAVEIAVPQIIEEESISEEKEPSIVFSHAAKVQASSIPTDSQKALRREQDLHTDEISSVEVKTKGVSKAPLPLMGEKAYQKYLKENLKRPTDSECANSKGKVIIHFHVNEKGRPYNLIVKKSLCKSADEEAIRLIKEGPDWSYGNKEVSITIKF